MRKTKKLGDWGENFVAEWLKDKEYQLVEKNYHSRYGELDLIMLNGDHYVFVEVKTRTTNSFGFAEYSITPKKISALTNTIYDYFVKNEIQTEDWQLDVVILEKNDFDLKPRIIHYENVSEVNGN